MNKNIIIAILIVIIIAVGAAFVLGQSNGKTNTQINIINNETFQPGEHVDIELKDAQGKALSSKNVEINFNNQKYQVTTDQNGKCYLNINGVSSGKYNLEAKFAGDDTYNGCDAKVSITIDTDSTADNIAEPTDSSASTASLTDNSGNNSDPDNSGNNSDPNKHPGLTYYAQYGAYVDENGIVVSYNDGVGDQLGVGHKYEDAKKVWDGEVIPDDMK